MTPNLYQKSVGSHLVQGPQYGDFVLGRYTRLFFECEIGWVGPLFGKVYRPRHDNDPNGYANDWEGIPAFFADLPVKVGRRKKVWRYTRLLLLPSILKNKNFCEGRLTNNIETVGWLSHFCDGILTKNVKVGRPSPYSHPYWKGVKVGWQIILRR